MPSVRFGRPLCNLPDLSHACETFDGLVRKLSSFFVQAIEAPYDWDELRRDVYGPVLKPLVRYLVDKVQHEAIVCALLALKAHFAATEDERGINETRGLACEMVAWRFVTGLTYRESIDFLCWDLPAVKKTDGPTDQCEPPTEHDTADEVLEEADTEQAPLMDSASQGRLEDSFYDEVPRQSECSEQSAFAALFADMNALEIAVVSGSKKFLGQKVIQRIIDGIWKGDIVFWETLGAHSKKRAHIYRKSHADPFCRLRVPLYLKMFEVLFFAVFLSLYYIVLVEKRDSVSAAEIMLYLWLTSFAYNELVEYWDAGSMFYAADFWSLWDLGIILVGIAFFIARMIGLFDHKSGANDVAFDLLSVEALFLVPRICSLLSLHPYFGTLIPILKEMTKDFVKFLGLVAILYLGFTTTFSFLARGHFTFGQMNWILIKVFFGSSYLGFDIADQISHVLGPVLMFIFVCMTNILLITSLISLLSNKLDTIMLHAHDEFLNVYAVYVLEAATSNRLTFFIPPMNLFALILRPLRLIFPQAMIRRMKVVLLKATHWPLLLAILGFEHGRLWLVDRRGADGLAGRGGVPVSPTSLRRRPLSMSKALSATRLPLLAEQPRMGSPAGSHDPPAASETEATITGADSLRATVSNLQREVETLTEMLAREREVASRLSANPEAHASPPG